MGGTSGRREGGPFVGGSVWRLLPGTWLEFQLVMRK
jgi:hypothetical protein